MSNNCKIVRMSVSQIKDTWQTLLSMGFDVLDETEGYINMLHALDSGLITHDELETFEIYWTQIQAGLKKEKDNNN